jgi:hypothetical protein
MNQTAESMIEYEGHVPLIGPESCQICPPNSSSLSASVLQTSCLCSPGYTGPDAGPCEPCPANMYKSVPGPSECLACANDISRSDAAAAFCSCMQGHQPNASVGVTLNGASCVWCSGGTYKLGSNNDACTPCETEERPADNSYWQDPAPPYSFCPFFCDEGYFKLPKTPLRQYQCAPCEAVPSENPCPAGQYWNSTCSSSTRPSCVPCTNMVGNGIYRLPNYNWL